jgi:hypothetical protein
LRRPHRWNGDIYHLASPSYENKETQERKKKKTERGGSDEDELRTQYEGRLNVEAAMKMNSELNMEEEQTWRQR